MKGHNMPVKMYTQDGKHTLDIDQARRFYNRKNNIMVNLDTTGDLAAIDVGLGKSADIDSLRKMLDKFRMLSNRNVMDYNLKTFGKDINPKDFLPSVNKAINSQSGILEGFTKPWGTVKTSRRRFENATLYIRHRKAVDEDIRGSRSRNISSIFIENDKNERFRFPYKNLPAARAMTVHVSQGGTPYDVSGQHILGLVEEMNTLKNFVKYTNRNPELTENKNELILETKKRILELKKTIGSMSSPVKYTKYFESVGDFAEVETDIKPNDDLFETHGVPELTEALPYLTAIMETIQLNNSRRRQIAELAKRLVELNGIPVKYSTNQNDIMDGIVYTMETRNASEEIMSFAQMTTDQYVSERLNAIAMDFEKYPSDIKETMNKVLTSMINSTIVVEQDKKNSDTNTLSESLDMLNEKLHSFGIFPKGK